MARSVTVASTAMPRVNLLPPSEVARRERERLAGRWTGIVIAVVILSALLIGAAWALNQLAQLQLAAEQSRTTTLIAEVGALSEVSEALAEESELTGYLAEAMGSDLVWNDIRTDVESRLPAGVVLVGFDLIPGAPAATTLNEEDAAAAVGLSGTLTFDSPNTIDIATVSRSLRDLGAVVLSDANALAESTLQEDRFSYTIDVIFDQSVYTGRFAGQPADGGDNG